MNHTDGSRFDHRPIARGPAIEEAHLPSATEARTQEDTSPQGDSSEGARAGDTDQPRTIKPRTRQTYERALETMIRVAEKKRRGDLDETDHVPVTLTHLVEDLQDRIDISPGSINVYRAALIWRAQTTAATSSHPGLVQEAKDMLRELDAMRREGGRPKSDGAVPIPEIDYTMLLAELLDRAVVGSDWAARAHAWLMAGVLTGVRPSEWPGAAWCPESPETLRVVNGKVKLHEPAYLREKIAAEDRVRHGPGEPPATRLIPVPRAFDRKAVQTHMDHLTDWFSGWRQQSRLSRRGRPARSSAGAHRETTPVEELSDEELLEAYTAYYNGARSVIRHACLKLWGGERMYSLYSARHQYSANTRAELGPQETAERMGHSRPDSPSQSHYASRHAAHSQFRAAGSERPAQRVDFERRAPQEGLVLNQNGAKEGL